ncbi:MAG: hypothetical protein ACRDOO_10570 [Actinomadura sp.]
MSDVGTVECHEHKNGGPSLSFVAPEQEVSAVDQLIRGIRLCRPLIQPITAEAIIGCPDRELDYPDGGFTPQRPHWFIYDRSSVTESGGDQALDVIDPWHVDPVIEAAPQLSAEVIRSWLERAQAQPSPAPRTHDVGWTDLWFNATRALVCLPDAPSTSPGAAPRIALEVAETRWVAEVPCQWRAGAAWVAGPTREMRRHIARAPFTLRASNYGLVELVINANWSLWTEDRSPGRAALVDVARALLADGWRLDHTGRAFPELV